MVGKSDGGATPSSTSCTSAASLTATATASATSPAPRQRLPYLRDLGVDAIWVSPWYLSPHGRRRLRRRRLPGHRARRSARSPMRRRSSREALELGIRTIVDIVPNHVSDQHAWFEAALAAGPGSPLRERFWFRPGEGTGRRTAAQRLDLAFRRHRLDPHQEPGRDRGRVVPPPVRAGPARPELGAPRRPPRARGRCCASGSTAGAAGVRIDSAALAMKHPDAARGRSRAGPGGHPFEDRDELHDLYRELAVVGRRLRPERGC